MKKTENMLRNFVLIFLAAFIFLSCRPSSREKDANSESAPEGLNPPAEGFNAAASDPEAITIADSVMMAMGGRQAWDNTRFLRWNFFGRRSLLWDKFTGDVRIEIPADTAIYIVNIHSLSGIAREGNRRIQDPDTLKARMQRAKSIWINDSYWLVMPFKLKDSGVTLKYLGPDTTLAGAPADVLELTFEAVGDTPENKYHVYVDTSMHLVRQWAFFRKASDEKPAFITPWDDYRKYGRILLSGNRGESRLTDIGIFREAPMGAFSTTEFIFGGAH